MWKVCGRYQGITNCRLHPDFTANLWILMFMKVGNARNTEGICEREREKAQELLICS